MKKHLSRLLIIVALIASLCAVACAAPVEYKLKLSTTAISLEVGDTYDASALASVENNPSFAITYTSSDVTVLEINGTSFVAKKEGSAIVTATAITPEGSISANATVNVASKVYTVTFLSDDGNALKSVNVLAGGVLIAGDMPSTQKSSTAQYDYIFAGWQAADGNIWNSESAITSSLTLTATYTKSVRKYDISFDGEIVKLGYGEAIVAPNTNATPADTAEWDYTFLGWVVKGTDKIITDFGSVLGNVEYETKYDRTKRTYTVSFDGVESSLEYGSAITAVDGTPADTAEWDYTFLGWKIEGTEDSELVDMDGLLVTGELSFITVYTKVKRNYPITIDGVVRNLDYGTVIGEPNTNATPEDDYEWDYTFLGFVEDGKDDIVDLATLTVTGEATFKTKYSKVKKQYDVSFDGAEPVKYDYGANITPPTPSDRDTDEWDYTFVGWKAEGTADVELVDFETYRLGASVNFVSVWTKEAKGFTISLPAEQDGYELTSNKDAYQAGESAVLTLVVGEHYNQDTKAIVVSVNGTDYEYSALNNGKLTFVINANAEVKVSGLKPNKYTISFDGAEQVVEYGKKATVPTIEPTKPSTDSTVYTFAGWAIEGTSEVVTDFTVKGETTYVPVWSESVREHYVTFRHNNQVYVTATKYAYGAKITEPTAPTKNNTAKYTYTFVGWKIKDTTTIWDFENDTVSKVTVLESVFEESIRVYAVIYQNDDGSEIGRADVEYGSYAKADAFSASKADDIKYSYTFDYWKGEDGARFDFAAEITSVTILTAVYKTELVEYAVQFLSFHGTEVLFTATAKFGEKITNPGKAPDFTDDTRIWTFGYWSCDGTGGEEYDFDSAVAEQMLQSAKNKIIVFMPVYNFSSKPEATLWSVKFFVDGVAIDTKLIVDGEKVEKPADPVKESTADTVYTFTKWVKKGTSTEWNFNSAITEALDLEAQFTQSTRKYTVYVQTKGASTSTVLTTLEYGVSLSTLASERAENYEKDNYIYTFDGWKDQNGEDFDFTATVTEDVIMVASYVKSGKPIEVIFKNSNGKTLATEYFEYGTVLDTAKVPTATKNQTASTVYVFAGWETESGDIWDVENGVITEKMTLTATFSEKTREYTVKIYPENGGEMTELKVAYGSTVDKPADPVKNSTNEHFKFQFKYWAKNSVSGVEYDFSKAITGSVNLYAVYETVGNEYALTVIVDGVRTTTEYIYPALTVAPEAPKKPDTQTQTYSFVGWYVADDDGNATEIEFAFGSALTSDIVVVAKFQEATRYYEVVYYEEDGVTELNKKTYNYGAMLTAYPAPQKTDVTGEFVYTFTGWQVKGTDKIWNFETEPVTTDLSFVPTYSYKKTQWEITYTVDGVETKVMVDYGKTIGEAIGEPTKSSDNENLSYEFFYWENEDSERVEQTTVVTTNLTLYAVFKEVWLKYQADYSIDGKVNTVMVDPGTTYAQILPASPTKASGIAGVSYTFTRWVDSNGNALDLSKAINSKVSVKAMFTCNDTWDVKATTYYPKYASESIDLLKTLKYSVVSGSGVSVDSNGLITVSSTSANANVKAYSDDFEKTFNVSYTNYVMTHNASNPDPRRNAYNDRKTKADAIIKGKENANMVFVGDSFFDPYFWDSFYTTFAGKNIITVGISSATTYDVQEWASTYLFPYKPNRIVMHIGTNDIWDIKGTNGTIAGNNVVNLFNYIHAVLPETQIYWYSIEYRSYAGSTGNWANKEAANAESKVANNVVKTFCNSNSWATYMDSTVFANDETNKTVSSLMGGQSGSDGCHPLPATYSSHYIPLLKQYVPSFDEYVRELVAGFKMVGAKGTVSYNANAKTITTSYSNDRDMAILCDSGVPYCGNFAISGTANMTINGWLGLGLSATAVDDWFQMGNALPMALIFKPDGSATRWGWYPEGSHNANVSVCNVNLTSVKWQVVNYNGLIVYKINDTVVYFEHSSGDLYFSIRVSNATFNSSIEIKTKNEEVSAVASELVTFADSHVADTEIAYNATAGSWDASEKTFARSGATLKRNYVISATFTVTQVGANSHFGWEFGNSNNRIILWDNNDGTTGNYRLSYNNNGTWNNPAASDSANWYNLAVGSTITWKLVVTDNDAYLYINNVLKIVVCNLADTVTPSVNAELTGLRITGITAYVQGEAEYTSAKNALPSVSQASGSTYTYVRV